MAACCAAKGVPLRDPRKPREPELFQESTRPSRSQMVTRVLLNDAWMCTTAWGTCLRSFFLNCFFLPFFSGAAGAPVAAAGFAMIVSVLSYVFAADALFTATVPFRGPLRVRAFVCVLCPRTGRLRRWRYPR